ncbi:hypothetical protein BH23PLA1_BH23PLA1_04080 [soil metagenome]
MFQGINLRELSEMRGPERAFVSLYSSGSDGLDLLKGRVQRLREILADDTDEAEHFERNMDLLREALEADREPSPGLCLFACWALDFLRVYPLPVPVLSLLRVDAAPYIRPLAELQDEHEDFLIIAENSQGARVFQVTSATAEQEDQVKGDVKNRVRKGGWSQQRYARRREKQLHDYAKEVAERLEVLCRQQEFDRIILLGSDEATREIESSLSQQVAARVVGRKSVDLHCSDQDLVEQAYALYFEEERASEERLWETIKGEYLRGGLAVAGAADVLEAALVGRIEAMIVTRDAKLPGVRCRDCGQVVAGAPTTCPACASDSVFPVDLVEDLVHQLEQTSAEAEFTDPIPGLSKLGDVAALLRY